MDVVLTAVDFSLVSFFATTMLLPLFANMCSVFADWCEVSTHLLIVSLPLASCSLHYFLPAVPLVRCCLLMLLSVHMSDSMLLLDWFIVWMGWRSSGVCAYAPHMTCFKNCLVRICIHCTPRCRSEQAPCILPFAL